jgi:hypothetical protein
VSGAVGPGTMKPDAETPTSDEITIHLHYFIPSVAIYENMKI